ncbi:hypothetical protein R3L02_42570 [Streptomyces scabiei]|uniref:hypothetical protein n=1 Tax=Streptomyces scabiei TaxID=1930 RepID=UPI00298F1EC6|nr:hypothetical protein [Streptomyces scabiei]MDW8478433.1 hypothetical protein [Streptomyces scabiei]
MSKITRPGAASGGAIAVEGLEFILLAVVAGIGGWIGSTTPGLSPAWAGVSAGIFGLGLAAGANDILASFMASLRARTRTSPSPAAPASEQSEEKTTLPSNTDDVLELLTEAAAAGAAHQAAMYSGKLDPAHALLDRTELWVGVDGTSALFRLADGAYVYYEKDESGSHPSHLYSFVVPETGNEPVPVTSLEQVRDLLEQHATRELKDEPVAA